ncbi:MAG: NAD(P)-dependent alcohol dehydrogenase [Ardenticatenales bacterium]
MKAIVQDRYGSADVLQFKDIAKPEPGADDVLVRVHAAGVDRGVWHLMTGLPYLMRVIGMGFRAPKAPVRGREVAGTVEAVGGNVTAFKAGDEVYGFCDGSFAEYVCAKATQLAPKPTNVSFEQAAVVPVSAITALHAVRDAGGLKAGQTAMIIGASGGVGTFAVQIAKAIGAEVTGVCSTGKADMVRSIGADHVIDYTREDCADGSRRYDLIVDMGGRRPLSQLRRALNAEGTLVVVGGEGGDRWLGGFLRGMLAPLRAIGSKQKLRGLMPGERKEDVVALTGLIEAGTVVPVVDKAYPLREAADAVRYMEQGRARGKVVVRVLEA